MDQNAYESVIGNGQHDEQEQDDNNLNDDSSSSLSNISEVFREDPSLIPGLRRASQEDEIEHGPMPLAIGVKRTRRLPNPNTNSRVHSERETTISLQPQQQQGRSPIAPQIEQVFDGTRKQLRDESCDSDEASYYNLGWEFKRRRLLTAERKKDLLPAKTRLISSSCLEMLDLDQLAASTVWGERGLFDRISKSEVDKLVGLATTLGATLLPVDIPESHLEGVAVAALAPFDDPKRLNPLIQSSFSRPFPPSILNYLRSRALSQVAHDHAKHSAMSTLNDSAAVAIGMALEEAITASLLPLAGLHVLRCRALEEMDVSDDTADTGAALPHEYCSNYRTALHPITGDMIRFDMAKIEWKTEKAFDQWTLPPEEAVMKLLQQGLIPETGNHFLLEPCRKMIVSARTPFSNIKSKASSSKRQSKATKALLEREQYLKIWSKRLGLDPSVIQAHPEVVGIFMSPVPSF